MFRIRTPFCRALGVQLEAPRSRRLVATLQRSAGFSTIEILVALLIFALILTAAMDTLRMMRRTVNRAEAALVDSLALSRDVRLLEMVRYADPDSIILREHSNGDIELSARTLCRLGQVMPSECTLTLTGDRDGLRYVAAGTGNRTTSLKLAVPRSDLGSPHPCRPLATCLALAK
ncbi:PulJ/GspJ family protein [Pannonibacter tanglangensis]|uniref:Prepilin-type N-terminal cleavage/methylation domain-containing protein n=1 Tax=Pannonibacter tanglangensis TaxID=2750084 RepID=A0ABW9ZMC4_9HYPH|nr:type II secretion system protein [Pannonibacter sp. XCT-34]NBN66070.1 hypothetical protein [Pannonibacter sp. XCT-34]